MNDELRRTMQKAAGIGEPAVGDAFARFTAVRRRAALARSAVVAVVGLTAAVALIFTLPGLDSGDTGGSLGGGEATTPPNMRAVKHYEDTVLGFELDYPADWTVSSEEGSYVRFLAPGDLLSRSTLTACTECATADVFTIDRVMIEIRARAPGVTTTDPVPADELARLRAAGAEVRATPPDGDGAVLQFGTKPVLTEVREPVELRWWSAASVTTRLEDARTGPVRVETIVVDPREAERLIPDLEIILTSIAPL